MQIETFTEKLETNYKYMKINDEEADVFIYNFKEKRETEESGIEYLYEFNAFRVKQNEITEEMMKEDPLKYLNYTTKKMSVEERMGSLEKEVETLKTELKKYMPDSIPGE